MGGPAFPFGSENDPGASLSILGNARMDTMARAIATLGLIGAAAMIPYLALR